MSEYLLFKILLITLFAVAIAVFPTLMFIPAPYGRHVRPGWGFRINSKLGWAILESPEMIVFALCFALGNGKLSIVSLFFLIMWETHYINRSIIYSARIRNSQKRIPFLVMVLGILFSMITPTRKTL